MGQYLIMIPWVPTLSWHTGQLVILVKFCQLYYDILSAYLIMIPWVPTLLWYPDVEVFVLPALLWYPECLPYYDTLSAYRIMISEPAIIIKQANVPTLLWYHECLSYYDILTWIKDTVPALLWYPECLPYSYIQTACFIMTSVQNRQKVPTLLIYP